MRPRGVAARDEDASRVIDVLVAGGRRIGAQRLLVAGHRRRHAKTRVRVDVVGPDEALRELVERVVVLGEELARHIERDRIGAVPRNRVREPPGEVRERLIPGLALVVYLREQTPERRIGLVQRQALGAQAAEVRRMLRIAPHGNDRVAADRGEDAAADAAVAAGRRDLAPGLDPHETVLDPRGIHRDAHRDVFEAAAGGKAEVLLVDRRGDDQLALQIAHDPARDDVGAREGIEIAYRVNGVVIQPEDRNLLASHQRAHAGVRHDIRELADLMRLQLPAPRSAPAGSGRARRRRRHSNRGRRCSRSGGSA